MTSPQDSSPQTQFSLEPYFDGLYGYAMVLTRNRSDAEDLVQETCVRAIPALGSLRPDSNLKSWLFTILRNVWLNQLRRQRNGPRIVELDAEENPPEVAGSITDNPHAIFVSELDTQRVREAIEQLSTEFREIILLREFEDLSYQEIATLLDCPPGTVMSRLGRARSKLRSLLSGTSQAANRREKRTQNEGLR